MTKNTDTSESTHPQGITYPPPETRMATCFAGFFMAALAPFQLLTYPPLPGLRG